MRMEGNARIWFTPKQKAELWERWKSGQCVADIARALDRRNKSGIYRVLALNGGIAPAWSRSDSSIESQHPIDAALVPPIKRSRDVRHTLTALPALPELSLLLRREPYPCIPLHTHTSSSGKIRRCCVDRLNPQPLADMLRTMLAEPHRRKQHP